VTAELGQFQTVVRTKRDAETAVQADKGFFFLIEKNGLNRAGGGAQTATVAHFLFDHHPSSLARHQGPGGAGFGAGRRVAGQAMNGGESSGQTTGRMNPNPRRIPGKTMMKQASAGQGTGVAANTSVHSRCS
jgi:hypothetical protein